MFATQTVLLHCRPLNMEESISNFATPVIVCGSVPSPFTVILALMSLEIFFAPMIVPSAICVPLKTPSYVKSFRVKLSLTSPVISPAAVDALITAWKSTGRPLNVNDDVTFPRYVRSGRCRPGTSFSMSCVCRIASSTFK